MQARRDELRAEWDAVRDRKSQLEGQKQFADALKAQIAALDSEIRDFAEELAGHQRESGQGQRAAVAAGRNRRDFEKLTQARASVAELEKGLEQFHRGQQSFGRGRQRMDGGGKRSPAAPGTGCCRI